MLIGDMMIKDLTPDSENIGGRLVKNMCLCGSGIYKYHKSEADLLGLTPIPEEFLGDEWINVYRPPEVLIQFKDYFARVPIITGRHIKIDRDNAKQFSVGLIGDCVRAEVNEEDGETYLYTTGTIIAGDGVSAYERYGQLSVGYEPLIEWERGEHNGNPYQAVLKGFLDVNHVLICKKARGGSNCMVMDSLEDTSPLEKIINEIGGKQMSLFNRIFGHKLVGDEKVVQTLIQSIAAGADPSVQVPKIKEMLGDSKDAVFCEYLDNLCTDKDAPADLMKKACDAVEDYYIKNIAGDAKEEEPKEKEEEPKEKEPKEKEEEPKEKEEGMSGDAIDSLAEEIYGKVVEKLKDQYFAQSLKNIEEGMTMHGDAKPAEGTFNSSEDVMEFLRG